VPQGDPLTHLYPPTMAQRRVLLERLIVVVSLPD
jgi:hypothetical protein